MIVGIRVESEKHKQALENIVTPLIYNGLKDAQGNNAQVPGFLSTEKQVRRFINCLKQISVKKKRSP
jgi:dephospho-CoA kinase